MRTRRLQQDTPGDTAVPEHEIRPLGRTRNRLSGQTSLMKSRLEAIMIAKTSHHPDQRLSGGLAGLQRVEMDPTRRYSGQKSMYSGGNV